MEENKEDYYSLSEIVNTIKSFLRYLRGKWWILVLAVLAGGGLGVVYYFVQKPKYEAVTTFILEEKSAGGGGMAGLASQFGFDIGSLSGGGGSIFAGDNIFDILRSKKIMQKVLLSKVDSDKGDSSETLADLFLDFRNWKKKWSSPDLKNISYAGVGYKQALSLKQDSVLNLIHEFLLKKSLSTQRVNKKGSIIKVQVTAMNSLFARLMTERLVEEAAKMYLNIKTGTAQANIDRMQRRSDSLLALLNNKSYAAAATQLLDPNPGVKTAAVSTEIALRDKTVISTLYVEVTKNLETSKMLLAQQTPVIQLLDHPGYLLQDNKKRLSMLLFAFSIGAALVYVMLAFILFHMNTPKKITH